MVEIIQDGLAIKTECRVCGAELKFKWSDMKYLTDKDLEYQYIKCPICHTKIFVRNDDSGWMNGTERIYEDTNVEKL